MDNQTQTFTVTTAKLGGRHIPASPEKVREEALHTWEFEYREPTGEDEIECGRRAVAQGLFSVSGASDPVALDTSRGYTLLDRLVKKWSLKTADGQPLPLTVENVKTVPSLVARRFASEVLEGRLITEAEMEAVKKP